nr:uncharacterized protein LOC129525345 [Gorilla gorilla gorilla]
MPVGAQAPKPNLISPPTSSFQVSTGSPGSCWHHSFSTHQMILRPLSARPHWPSAHISDSDVLPPACCQSDGGDRTAVPDGLRVVTWKMELSTSSGCYDDRYNKLSTVPVQVEAMPRAVAATLQP